MWQIFPPKKRMRRFFFKFSNVIIVIKVHRLLSAIYLYYE